MQTRQSDPALLLPPRDGDGRRSFTAMGWVALFIVLASAQLLIYHASFNVQPAGDDFGPPLTEILRGNAQGPGAFFLRSAQFNNYRPLQSLAMWLAGRLGGGHPYVAIRILHFACMDAYAVVAFLWLRLLPIRRSAATLAAIVLFLHPGLPAPLGSIDGFGTLASSAFLWLGALAVFRWRSRLAPGAVAAVLCFVIGVGFKEFLFALVPLAGLVMLVFRRDRWWVGMLAVSGPLMLAFVALMAVRHATIPPGFSQGEGYLSFSPHQLVENAVIFALGTLFLGNTIWVFLHATLPVLAGVGLSVLAVVAWVLIGLNERFRTRPNSLTVVAERTVADVITPQRWATFFALSFVAASFPANVAYHVSEMYLAPLVLPFAMLSGLAADGWLTTRPPARLAALLAFAVAGMTSIEAITAKIAGLTDVGRRADAQVRQVLAQLPAGQNGTHVALVFLNHDLARNRTYSVFRIGDEMLINEPADALEWPAPGRGLVKDTIRVDSIDAVRLGDYDVVLLWDAAAQRFVRVGSTLTAG